MMTLRNLHYTTDPYYFRVEARNGSKRKFSSTIGAVGLTPLAPSNLVATTGLSGTSLSWTAGAATGFQVTQATNSAMTQNVRTYTIQNEDHQFTPPNLTVATPYYFQVRALNGETPSTTTSVIQTLDVTQQQPLRVMSYNLLEISADGRFEGGTRVAPWSQRRAGQVKLIKNASPDIISIQEGSSWVGPAKGPRQVDDLVSALGGEYALASTEVPPDQPHFQRTGVYILYKPSEYGPVGTGNHWAIGDGKWAAYQILQHKVSGAQFLFVAPHLSVPKNGGTDAMRAKETKSMVAQAEAYARQNGHLPIIYAGDFNSDPSKTHKVNAPSEYLLSKGYDDAFDAAQARTNARFNSANQYERTPPAHALRLDYIFTQAGIAVTSWAMLLHLNHSGHFAGVIPSDHNPVVADLLVPYFGLS
jgi:endonuclease/exonuclease/phosphatase family metal-dependent hydrolase